MAICHSQGLFSNQNNKGASGAFRPEVIAVLFKAHSNGRGSYISKFIILITIVTLLLSDGVWRPPPTTVECFHHCDRQLPFLLSSPSPAQFVDLCTNNFSFSICPVRDIICWFQMYIYDNFYIANIVLRWRGQQLVPVRDIQAQTQGNTSWLQWDNILWEILFWKILASWLCKYISQIVSFHLLIFQW